RCVRAATAAAAIAMALLPVSASGQGLSGSAQAAAAQAAAQPAPTGPVRRLSVDEAVKLALEQNLGIRIQRIDPQSQDVTMAQARSGWAPTLTTAFNRQSQTLQSTNAFSGSGSNILNSTFSNQVGMTQTLPWGGQYTATWNSARLTTTNFSTNYQP